MTADLGQIESATIQTQVYQRLREALFTGLFAPGESLTIRNIATKLGTSPMPVREALQRLVAEHALMQMPNRTFRVMPFTPEMFSELTRIRMNVEGLAAAQAVRRATSPRLAQLQALNVEMTRGVEASDPARILRANREFHFTLYEQADMPQLMDIINGLWLRVGPYLMNAQRKLDNPVPFFRAGLQFHDRLIRAYEAGNSHAGSRAVACDIWHSARYFRRNVELINEPEAAGTARRMGIRPPRKTGSKA